MKTLSQFIFEADSRIKKVERIISQYFDGMLDTSAVVSNNEYYVNDNPNTTWMDYLIYNLRHTLGLMANSDVALLPNAAIIAYRDLHFDMQNQDLEGMQYLKRMLDIVKKDDVTKQEFTSDSNTSYNKLKTKYGAQLEAEDAHAEKEASEVEVTTNTDYEVIEIPDYETANKYGIFTGKNGNGCLCYTQGKGTWSQYTNDGKNKCYLALKKGWKGVPCEKGSNYPKDAYGLSMVWFFVSPIGKVVYSNVRWNHGYHDFDKVDNQFTKKELIELTGYKDLFINGPSFLEKYEDYVKLKNGNYIVKLNNRFNIVDSEGNELSDLWYEQIYSFDEGFACVELNYKYNFIDTTGKLISDVWYEQIYSFDKGFAKVKLNRKYNFIDTTCKLIFDVWYDRVGDFHDGFAYVELNGKWNFIDTTGKLISDVWYNWAEDFHDGFARVKFNGKWNFIDITGKLIYDVWYKWAEDFYDGFARVGINDKLNFIDTNGKPISDMYYDWVGFFYEGFAKVRLNNKYNFIDTTGKLISDVWYDQASDFHNGFASVKLNGKYNFIDTTGKLISDVWFDCVYDFDEGFKRVELNGKTYPINKRGEVEVRPGEWKKLTSEDDLNESYINGYISLKDYILEKLNFSPSKSYI